jgi:hypothetical protein
MRIFLFSLLLFISNGSRTQILFAGNHIIEGYLGLPNMARFSGGINFFTSEINTGEVTKFRGIAPSGIRYSYMITENLSFGFDLMYNSSNITTATTDTIYNGITGEWTYQQSTNQTITNRLRFHARMNFHIPTGRPESDSYFGVGIGSNNRWIKTFENDIFVEELEGSDASVLPFSMRICYGYRYFFGYNWGISGEVGLGGPLLSIGASYKL